MRSRRCSVAPGIQANLQSAVIPAPVAYAGEPGAFAEDAVLAALGEVPTVGLAGFAAVFDAVKRGTARAGVLPIENLVNGSVREVYDLLLASDLEIVGEIVVPVELCLAALPGETIDDIERVYSHAQALGQAEAFLRPHDWTLLSTYNTAGAGRLIVDAGERGAAAILSPRAAERFGLEVLAHAIQDVADNRTRFVVIRQRGNPPAELAVGPYRTTFAFAVRNEPGTLLAALKAFADRDLNLSSLESRPSRTAAWEYVFWSDLDASASDPAAIAAFDDLSRVSTMVRILGSYPRS